MTQKNFIVCNLSVLSEVLLLNGLKTMIKKIKFIEKEGSEDHELTHVCYGAIESNCFHYFRSHKLDVQLRFSSQEFYGLPFIANVSSCTSARFFPARKE